MPEPTVWSRVRPITSLLGQPLSSYNPERLIDDARNALSNGADWRAVLDALPAPIYTTGADGAVTYWNRACVELAGREPQLGADRWCVTWQLYTTTGEFMPHDQCPMAEAIRIREPVRDKVAIALRPDGSRIAFRAYPTPLFAADGTLTGAINLLLDVSEEQAGSLADQAERCRRLAGATYNREVSDMLGSMAEGFERSAEELSKRREA